MLRRTGFTRPVYNPPRQPVRAIPALFRAPARIEPEVKAVPKTEPKRCPALLELARGRQCLLRVPDVCQGGTETTVSAHSNLSIHGKAKGRKSEDCYSVWSCAACHSWLDNGPAWKAQKAAAFLRAHADQVLAWRAIATGMEHATDRHRRAAQWALRELNAWPEVSE